VSTLLKIAVFMGFLVAYTVWLVAAYKINKKWQRDLISRKSLFSEEMTLLMSIPPVFVFIWILSGFFNAKLVVLLFAAAHIGLAIRGILWALIGSPQVAWGARILWAGGEYGMKHPILMVAIMVFAFLVCFIIYPVVAGIIYFSHTVPSDQETLLIFKATILILFLSSLLILLPGLVMIMLFKSIDDETRDRMFITQISGLVTTALYLSLIFWSFGIVGEGVKLSFGAIPLTISPLLLIVLVSYFVFALLLPYLCGWRGAKRLREYLLKKRLELYNQLLNILEFPSQASYISELEQLQTNVEEHTAEFVAKDKMVKLCEEFDRPGSLDDISPELHTLYQAYKESRHLDCRFEYLDFLKVLPDKIKEVMAALQGSTDANASIQMAKDYAAAYRNRRDEIADKITEVRRSPKPLLWVGLAAILSPILSQILSEVSKWISSSLMQTLGQ
jgi:hypothetical protein